MKKKILMMSLLLSAMMLASWKVSAADLCVGGAPDGVFDAAAGEECDDGNTSNSDCCRNDCNAGVDGKNCDDGNDCTDGEACTAGVCGGGTNVADGDSCDDGNDCSEGEACTAGVCGGATDAADGTGCDSVCTLNGLCTAGVCGEGNPRNEGDACSDNDACTEDDVCTAGLCAGVAVSCDDADACTTDSCNATTGACVNTPLDTDECAGGGTGGGDGGGCSLIR